MSSRGTNDKFRDRMLDRHREKIQRELRGEHVRDSATAEHPDWINRKQLAAVLGLEMRSLYHYTAVLDSVLRARGVGGFRRYFLPDVEKLVAIKRDGQLSVRAACRLMPKRTTLVEHIERTYGPEHAK